MSSLSIIYHPEDEWHGELVATVQSDGFSGRGAAWFNLSDVRVFAAALGPIPIIPGEAPNLQGGYLKGDGDNIDQTLVLIRIEPFGNTGQIQVYAQLANSDWHSGSPKIRNSVTVRFLVSYEDLRRFRSSLDAHLDGGLPQAMFQSSASTQTF